MDKKQRDKLIHGAMQNLDTANPKDLKRAIKIMKKNIKQFERDKTKVRLIA